MGLEYWSLHLPTKTSFDKCLQCSSALCIQMVQYGDYRLVGGWTNPSEKKYLSNWKASPNRGAQKHIFETTTQTSYVRSSKCKIYCKAGRQNVPIYLQYGEKTNEDGQYLSIFQDESYTSVIVPTLKPTSKSTRKPSKKEEVSSCNSPFFSRTVAFKQQ